MINQVTVEALHSANYVENYLDSVENLPDDVQRHLSRIREIDVLYRNHLRDVSIYYEQLNGANGTSQLNGGGGGGGAGSDSSSTAATPAPGGGGDQLSQASKRAMVRMQQGLIAAQELGDEKLQIVQHLQDLIDHKTRQLDQDYKNLGSDFFSRLDYGREEKLSEQKEIRTNSPGSSCSPNTGNSNSNNNGNSANNANSSPSSAPLASSTGNGPSSGGASSGGNGGSGSAHNSSASGAGSGGYTSGGGGGGGANSNNGAGSGGNGSGGSVGGGGSGGNGNGGSERGSKRARRTRNEQTGGSANNGSSTPNSTSGAMEVDPIDTSNIKQEVVGTSGGAGQASGNGGGGASGSGSNSGGKTSGSGSGGGGGSGAGSGGTAGGSGSGSGGAGGGSGQGASGGAQGKKGGAAAGGKKKKRKTGGRGQAREAREDTPPPEETIDPDEPTYCLCDQISFGEMILCDNDLCPIEWFHFSCVALMSKPKGKWFCPNCRGDRPNVMKPKAQFLKELERYNKEKEEKT